MSGSEQKPAKVVKAAAAQANPIGQKIAKPEQTAAATKATAAVGRDEPVPTGVNADELLPGG